jgi:hypothetical protein
MAKLELEWQSYCDNSQYMNLEKFTMWGPRLVYQCMGSYNVLMWQWNGKASKGPPRIVVTLGYTRF